MKLENFFNKKQELYAKKNVIAIDYSGSTYSQKNYWEKVKSVLEKTNDIDTVYTFWDYRENPEITKKERAKEIIELLIKGEGYGGATDPSTFIPVLVKESSLEQAPKEKEEKKDITLTLITDGQITPLGYYKNYPIRFSQEELNEQAIECIKKCDEELKKAKIKFSKLEVYFVNTGGPIDKSVAAPFLRRADKYSYQYPLEITEKQIRLITNLEFELLKGDFESITKEKLDLTIKEKFESIAKQQPKPLEDQDFKLITNLEADLTATLKPELIPKFKQIITERCAQIIKQKFLLITEQGSRLDLSIYHEDPQKFLEDEPTIIKKIEDQGLGSKNQDIIAELTKLRKKLLNSIQNEEIENNKPLFKTIKSNLKEGRVQEALEKLDRMIKQEQDISLKKKILEAINRMIVAAESGYDLSFDKSTANRLKNAGKEADETEEDKNEINLDKFEGKLEGSEQEGFALRVGKFVVHIKDNEQPIFDRIEKPSQNYFLNHPLAMLNNKDLRKSIRAFLTRIEFAHEQIQKFDENNYRALCKIFSGLNNLCIPFSYAIAILYFILVEDPDCLEKDLNHADFVKSLKEYMLDKLEEDYVSVRNQFFKIPASLVMVYDTLVTEEIQTTYIFKILDKLGYHFDKKKHQYAIRKNFYWMYDLYKNNSQEFEYWLLSLTGNKIKLSDGSEVILDANLSKEELDARRIPLQKDRDKPYIELNDNQRNDKNDDFLYSLSIREIIELRKIILENKNIVRAKIIIPDEIPSSNEGIKVADYNIEENDEENIRNTNTKVCCSTFRPYTQDPVSGIPWDKNSESNFGPLKYQIHLHKYLHDYVAHNKKFPSASNNYSNFIKYLYQGQAKKGIYTLPAPIVPMIEKLMRSYLVAAKEFLDSSEEIINLIADKVVKEKNKAEFMALYKNGKEMYQKKNESFTLDDFPAGLFLMISKPTQFNIGLRLDLEKLTLSRSMIATMFQTMVSLFQRVYGYFFNIPSISNQESNYHSARQDEEKTQVAGTDIDRLRVPSNQKDDSHHSAQKQVTGSGNDRWLQDTKKGQTFFDSPSSSNQQDDSHHSAIKSDQPNYLSKRN